MRVLCPSLLVFALACGGGGDADAGVARDADVSMDARSVRDSGPSAARDGAVDGAVDGSSDGGAVGGDSGVGAMDAAPAPDAGHDPRLPLGRPHFVVALGSFSTSARRNGVRLGTYAFEPGGAVTARMYLWSQTAPAARVGTGTTPAGDCVGGSADVQRCEVLTVDGFAGAPADVRVGTFEMDTIGGTPVVILRWGDTTPPYWESWDLEESADGLHVEGALRGSREATHGFMAGSHAPLDTRRAMSSVQAHPGPLAFDTVQWVRDEITTTSALPWRNSIYDRCEGSGATTYVMTYFQPSSPRSCRAGCVAPYDGDTSIQYYIQQMSSFDRRDTFWHWCTCLAQGAECYPPDGNSHVKPMLQILDDRGQWRGWVGVEASFYARRHAEPRAQDMLQVFRVFEP